MSLFHHYVKRLAAYTNYRGRRVLKRPSSPIKSLASEVIIHAPATTGEYPPPITLEGQIGRATDTFRGSLEDTIRYSTETEVNHRETKLYKIENVTIDNGYIYKNLSAEYISSLGSPQLHSPISKSEGLLSSTPSGSVYFGDWVIADNLLEELANQSSCEPI